MSAVLTTNRLCKNFGSLRALIDLDLEIESGQVWGFLGPNGSGKTTTLGILLGVLRPTRGQFRWFGGPLSGKIRRRIGALLEQPNFYPWLSGLRNLQIVSAIRGGVAKTQIEEVLKTVSLWDRRGEPYSHYSLGMKQRLGLASALMGQPEVLVLDEPTNGVDAQGIAEIRRVILEISSQGKTIFLASHILDEVEKICSHVVVLNKGETVLKGEISQVLSKGSGIEVAATDMNSLEKSLQGFRGVQEVIRQKDSFLVSVDEGVKSEDLNRFLVSTGIYASLIRKHTQSLESQFLDVLDKQR